MLSLTAYFVIGYDILLKAWKGIKHHQVFDENFLMAVATIGAIALGDYSEGTAVMLFYQIGNSSKAMRLERVVETLLNLWIFAPIMRILKMLKVT